MDSDLQAAHEIGKIYNSMLDKKLLCGFFLESVSMFVKEVHGFLFLASDRNQLWLESSTVADGSTSDRFKQKAEAIFQSGQPLFQKDFISLPLVVRNSAIGVACFAKSLDASEFSQRDFTLISDLSFQLAGALKNLLLYEQNLKMERLAAIGNTVSAVMHEIRNMIQLAKFSDEYLRMGIKEQKEKFVSRGLEGIGKALNDMEGFVQEMLSLTKDYKISPQQMNLQSMLDELRKDFQRRAEEFHVQLDFQIEEPFGEVEGDYKALCRALVNLVKNAIEARKDTGTYVRIRVRSKDKDSYEIVLEDNGKGMTDEVKAKVFQAFYTTKGEHGTGLGLMIIDRTIKAHRGEIQVESEAGKGTKFTITLPKVLSH